MKVTRLLPVTVVVLLLIALTSWWPGAGRDRLRGLEASALPTAGGVDALSATWYCAAGGADTPSSPRHALVLSNPDDEPAPARLTAYGPDGTVGTQSVEVPAEEVQRVEVAELFEADDVSVLVESPSGGLTVEHRLVTDGGADQVACATSSSEEWFFPSQTTAQVVGDGGVVERTTAARLVLFNPFSEDAGLDVTAAVDDGLRAPSAWAGVVVPSGTVRVLDVGEHIQRREQASLSVELRRGRVIAETVQVLLDGSGDDGAQAAGLRLQAGVPAPASRWAFAMGFTGTGAEERLVVHNPSDRPAEVVVQVTPVGGAEMPPEPFELEVPGRRFSIIDLSAEGRVPGRGHHTIQVETGERTPVVVARLIEVTGGPAEPEEGEEPVAVPRPAVDAGATIGTGSPVVATRWLVPDVVAGPEHDAAVSVLNPGEGIVTVSATAFGDDGGARVLDEVEVPAGDAIVVRLAELDVGRGDVGISMSSTSPVLVERVITFPRRGDFAMGTAVPVGPRGGGALTRISEL